MFRWFVGLSMDVPIRDVTVFTKNRERLLAGDIAAKFMAAVLNRPRVKLLLSEDHFSVDGTLIEAWASMKSFKPKDAAAGGDDDATPPGTTGMTPPEAVGRNGERNFRGEKRSNDTHASTTDPDARLYRKSSGQGARLCHMGHLLMENRHALIVDATLAHATGTAGREAALLMPERLPVGHRITLAADKAYDVADFIDKLRELKVTPHVAQNTSKRRSAIEAPTTRHPGHAISQRIRKRIEEAFGWMKTCGGMRKTRHRGTQLVGWMFTLTAAACNVLRLPKLLAAAG